MAENEALVEVTQADRNAADALAEDFNRKIGSQLGFKIVVTGDSHVFRQALARHRTVGGGR